MKNIYKILIVDDEIEYRETLGLLFESAGYEYEMAANVKEALDILEKQYCPIVVTDIMMEGINGIDFLKIIKERYHEEIEVIMVTGYGSVETAVETMKIGAYGYFIKSHNPEELLLELEKLSKILDLKKKDAVATDTRETFLNYSNNARMQKVWDMVRTVADTNANVLILGESGTGKEIIAKEIHRLSKRNGKPFIPINCQNFPRNLIESELFGHEKGAFTGATERRIGKLEQAGGGTVFFDEIGDMSLESQVKLLRTIEEKQIERLGSNTLINVDFRTLSATNRDIEQLIRQDRFREDFFYRINTIELKVPPLRNRREDLDTFISFFVSKFSKETGKTIKGIEPSTMKHLLAYNYPGNLRELKNIIERLVILAGPDGLLRMNSIPKESLHFGAELEAAKEEKYVSYKEAKREFDKNYIVNLLAKNENNITKTAEIMGLSRRQLFNKIKEYNIETGK